ncbi:MAG: fluoride efflux transporter CrcB [Telmatospirillum sp.]|nr:fluoride efflux transporter CrcB [Telmatospirillum sp.]
MAIFRGDGLACQTLKPKINPTKAIWQRRRKAVTQNFALYLWIAIGSAVGGVARHAASAAILAVADPQGLPWWTILVNVTGSFAIGFVAAATAPSGIWPQSETMRVFLTVGVLGGYTTFSAFSLQTFELARADALGLAALNVVLSVALCLAAVAAGFLAARLFE